HAALTGRVHDERGRPLGRDESEPDVVEDVRVVEEDSATEPASSEIVGERCAARVVLRVADLHAASSFSRHPGSISRSRRTRSATGGCVTNSAARPTFMKGLIV